MAPRRGDQEPSPPKLGVKPGVKPPPKKGRGRPRSVVFKCFTRHVDTKGFFVKNECNFCMFHSVDASENATYLKRHILSACGAAPEHVKATLGTSQHGAMHRDSNSSIPGVVPGTTDPQTSLGQMANASQPLLHCVHTRTEPSPQQQDVRIHTPAVPSPTAPAAPARTARPRRGRKRSPAPLSFTRNVDHNGKFFANICKYCSYVTKSENVTLLRNHLRSKDCRAPPGVLDQLRSPSTAISN